MGNQCLSERASHVQRNTKNKENQPHDQYMAKK